MRAAPRLAIFALEALPNARALRRFVADNCEKIAFVGLSRAERPSAGGLVAQVRRHLARSGLRILPYLAVNFGLPDLINGLSTTLRRNGPPEATPLAPLCRSLGIPVMSVDDVNGPEVADAFATHAPDLIVSFHFDQIFSAATLERAPLGGLNVHPSLLPRHRGPTPTLHALADGDRAFGVTVHRLAAAIDAGAILAQAAVPLPPGTSATRAAMLLHARGRELLEDVLADITEQGAVPSGKKTVPVLPYRGFPDRDLLARMHRAGLPLVDRGDWRAALRLASGP
ncbi:methionyl-tRNA formyltransferase [Methylorubrum sp. SB2]|uniref:methionyl-tRNA formyltransferase n=1 Tax=Methylorubrum subtropicum TaxID=3138812 RepID=UPI00313AD4F2